MKYTTPLAIFSVVGAVLSSGCETVPASADSASARPAAPASAPASQAKVAAAPAAPLPAVQPVVPVEPSPNEKALAAALATFDSGEYSLAIRQLTPLTADAALGLKERLVAMKTLAFAQCLTRALTSCRRTFEQAFRLDDKFELAPAERGHPVWGTQFERARKAVLH